MREGKSTINAVPRDVRGKNIRDAGREHRYPRDYRSEKARTMINTNRAACEQDRELSMRYYRYRPLIDGGLPNHHTSARSAGTCEVKICTQRMCPAYAAQCNAVYPFSPVCSRMHITVREPSNRFHIHIAGPDVRGYLCWRSTVTKQ